jgi:hypothetical protein
MAELNSRCSNEGKPWTATEDSLLAIEPDHILSVRFCRSIASIRDRRAALAIAQRVVEPNDKSRPTLVTIKARLTKGEAALCEQAAKDAGVSVSSWARVALVQAAVSRPATN